MHVLERLTKRPVLGVPADEDAPEAEEGLVNVGPAFIAHGKSSEPVEPCEGALHDPPVDAQPLLRLDATPGDPMLHPALTAGIPATPEVIPFVCVQLLRPLTRHSAPPVSHRRNRIDQRLEDLGVVLVRRPDLRRQWNPPAFNDQVVLAPSTTSIGWIRPRL